MQMSYGSSKRKQIQRRDPSTWEDPPEQGEEEEMWSHLHEGDEDLQVGIIGGESSMDATEPLVSSSPRETKEDEHPADLIMGGGTSKGVLVCSPSPRKTKESEGTPASSSSRRLRSAK